MPTEPQEIDVTSGQGAGDDTQVVTPPAPAQAASPSGEKTMVIPHSAIKRIREEERQSGRQTALDEFARANGFGSAADMAAAIAQAKAAPKAPQAPVEPVKAAPSRDDDDTVTTDQLAKMKDARREQGRYERQMEKTLSERNRYAQSATEWQRKAREAQADADAVRAEM